MGVDDPTLGLALDIISNLVLNKSSSLSTLSVYRHVLSTL